MYKPYDTYDTYDTHDTSKVGVVPKGSAISAISRSRFYNLRKLSIGLWTILCFIVLHTIFWTIEQIHYSYCTPCGFHGFLQSFFTSRSIICNSLRTVSIFASDASANSICFLISLIGSYAITRITRIN